MDPSRTGEHDEWGHRPTRSGVSPPREQAPQDAQPQARPTPAPLPRFAAVALPEPVLPGVTAPHAPYSEAKVTAGVPAFGTIAPGADAVAPVNGRVDQSQGRYTHSAAPPPSPSTAPKLTHRRVTVAGALPMWRAIVVGGLALAGALLSRLLVDWDDGRWWMLTAGLEIVALVCGIIAVVFGVGALGDLSRDRNAVKGTAIVAVGFPLACLLVIASGIVGGKDWDTLGYTDAWDRLRLGQSEDKPGDLEQEIDRITGRGALDPQELRTNAKLGECYGGEPSRPGDSVECDHLHRLEVIGISDLGGAGTASTYPARSDLEALARATCGELVATRFGDDDMRGELRVLVPDEKAWNVGDRRLVCLAFTELPARGPAE